MPYKKEQDDTYRMNQIWAKQEFMKRAQLEHLDREKLCELLFQVSCSKEYTNHAGFIATDEARIAYELLTSTWKE